MSEAHNLRAIKTQLSNSQNGFADDQPGTRSGRRSARGRSQPFFIGVAGTALRCYNTVLLTVRESFDHLHVLTGGTASGKTTVCDQIMQRLHDQCVVMLSQDCFYRGLTEQERQNVKGE